MACWCVRGCNQAPLNPSPHKPPLGPPLLVWSLNVRGGLGRWPLDPSRRGPPPGVDRPEETPQNNRWAPCRWVRGQARPGPETPTSFQMCLLFHKTGPSHAEPLKSQSRSLLGSCKKRCQGGAGLRSLSRACLLGFTVGVEESARLLLVFCLFALTLVWFPLK